MTNKSVVERLAELNPETEIWWDSSPLVYSNWKQKMLSKAKAEESESILTPENRFPRR